MENNWIPVSERLPEYDELVLVTANGKHKNITFGNAIELAVYATDVVYILYTDGTWEKKQSG